MTNENNNINELVDDDDPTAELELPKFAKSIDSPLEVDAKTFEAPKALCGDPDAGATVLELQSDLRLRQQTIQRLQYDIELLHAKWMGLEEEIGARETQTKQLNADLQSAEIELANRNQLLEQREQELQALRTEFEQRNEDYEQLRIRLDDSTPTSEPSEHDANDDFQAVQRRLNRSEKYTDTLRQKSQALIARNQDDERKINNLNTQLDETRKFSSDLQRDLDNARQHVHDLQSELDGIQDLHAEEIRTLRFELGEAQNTVAETEDVNNQLSSDLIDAQGFKDELERMLGDVEEKSSGRIDKLQKELRNLKRKAERYEEKLTSKSQAISALLAELAKRSERAESIGEIEEVIQDIDDRMSEHGLRSERSGTGTTVDRMTRLLVGTIEGQVLRFPLFRDYLTIGRTKDNDIQLKVAHVSRRHATIETRGGKTRIVDAGSTNGIHVNSARVSEHLLKHADIVVIGIARFRYEERQKREA